MLSLILFDSKVPHYSTKVLCHYDPREPASITTDAGTSLRVRIQSSPYPIENAVAAVADYDLCEAETLYVSSHSSTTPAIAYAESSAFDFFTCCY